MFTRALMDLFRELACIYKINFTTSLYLIVYLNWYQTPQELKFNHPIPTAVEQVHSRHVPRAGGQDLVEGRRGSTAAATPEPAQVPARATCCCELSA